MSKFEKLWSRVNALRPAIILIVVFVLALSLTAFRGSHSSAENGIAIVRVKEGIKGSCMGGGKSIIVTTMPSAQSTEVEIEDFANKSMEGNGAAITKTLNDLYAQGFRMKGTSSSMYQCEMVTTFVLEK